PSCQGFDSFDRSQALTPWPSSSCGLCEQIHNCGLRIQRMERQMACSRMEQRGASEIDGQAERPNGAYGKSDIEAKTAREAASELGKGRVSNERDRMSQAFRVRFDARISATGKSGITAATNSFHHPRSSDNGCAFDDDLADFDSNKKSR